MGILDKLDRDAIALWAPVVIVGVAAHSRVGPAATWTGSAYTAAGLALALAVPLLWRRTRPLLTAVVIACVLPVMTVLGGTLVFGAFIAAVFAAYAGGRWSASWRGTVACLLVLVAGAIVAGGSADGVIYPIFYLSAAAGPGIAVRRLAQQAVELTRLNDALARQVDLASQLAAEAERNRISRELHDTLAHTLMITVVQAEAAEELATRDPAAAADALRTIQGVGREGLRDLRATLAVLREDRPAHGMGQLPDLVRSVAAAGLAVDMQVGTDVPGPLESELYRVVQEALTNVVKHSASRTASVRVDYGDGGIEVVVSDGGPSVCDETPPTGGHGLRGMRERIEALGGSVVAGPVDDGWTVRAEVPA